MTSSAPRAYTRSFETSYLGNPCKVTEHHKNKSMGVGLRIVVQQWLADGVYKSHVSGTGPAAVYTYRPVRQGQLDVRALKGNGMKNTLVTLDSLIDADQTAIDALITQYLGA